MTARDGRPRGVAGIGLGVGLACLALGGILPFPLMLIVAILSGIIIAISLYPSKRQHTDL